MRIKISTSSDKTDILSTDIWWGRSRKLVTKTRKTCSRSTSNSWCKTSSTMSSWSLSTSWTKSNTEITSLSSSSTFTHLKICSITTKKQMSVQSPTTLISFLPSWWTWWTRRRKRKSPSTGPGCETICPKKQHHKAKYAELYLNRLKKTVVVSDARNEMNSIYVLTKFSDGQLNQIWCDTVTPNGLNEVQELSVYDKSVCSWLVLDCNNNNIKSWLKSVFLKAFQPIIWPYS